MANKRLLSKIRIAQQRLYKTLPRDIRILTAYLQITKSRPVHARRRVKAYSKGMITNLIDQEMRKQGITRKLEEKGFAVPDLDWGRYYMTVVNKATRMYDLDQSRREEVLAELVADTVMGRTVMPERGEGIGESWKANILGYIALWAMQDFGENRIKAYLTKFLNNKTANIIKRYFNIHERNRDEKSLQPGRPGDDYQGSEVYEGLLTMEGGGVGIQSLLRKNPEVKNLVNIMDKFIQRREGEDDALIWRAYLREPDASLNQLLEVVVRNEGRMMPLWEALGFEEGDRSNKGKLDYRIKKLRSLLRKKWPEVEEALNEVMAL